MQAKVIALLFLLIFLMRNEVDTVFGNHLLDWSYRTLFSVRQITMYMLLETKS